MTTMVKIIIKTCVATAPACPKQLTAKPVIMSATFMKESPNLSLIGSKLTTYEETYSLHK